MARAKIQEKAWDEDGIPLEDTNVAGIGSDEDKALRKSAALTEPAWQGVGLEPGLWIWRIEDFEVVAWPKEKYGTFHEGDSYILLHVEKELDDEGNETEALDRDIHFWLGRETSTDEKGTAAYKTVELDDFFDGEPVQHREVQGMETEAFLALFPKGIRYLKGGVASGFKVTGIDTFQTTLYQVRRNEKRRIIIEEEELERESLNHRDAFILDTGKKIFVFFGDSCSPFVKNAANSKAENMESERDGDSVVVTEIGEEFWAEFGGEFEVTPADQVGEEDPPDWGEGVLYKIQISEDRSTIFDDVARGELKKDMLDPTAIMMLDTRGEIIVWIGKDCNAAEQKSANRIAFNFLKTNERNPSKTPITALLQGQEKRNKTWMATFSD